MSFVHIQLICRFAHARALLFLSREERNRLCREYHMSKRSDLLIAHQPNAQTLCRHMSKMQNPLETVKSWIGKPLVVAIDGPKARPELWEIFCAAIEDANPLYWDDAAAAEHTGERIAPQSMMAAWTVAPEWRPNKPAKGARPLEAHFMVKEALDYPHGIVIEAEFEYYEPVRAGDRLRAEQVLLDIGEEKSTRLGPGREWVIKVSYTREDGARVGAQIFRFLGYRNKP